MKIGMNMLLWTGHVTEEHVPVLKALKATGFDGVEIPVFDVSGEDHYRWLAGVLDDIGLERTVVALIPDEAQSPISPDAAARAPDHLKRVVDCTATLGGQVVAGKRSAGAGRNLPPRSACGVISSPIPKKSTPRASS